MKALILIGLLAAAPALAQPAAPVCAGVTVVPGFEAWGKGAAGSLAVGAPAALTLGDATAVAYAPAPARAPAGSFGGIFPITIAKGGTYRLALSGKAWIDVAHDGVSLKSIAHQPGAPCSGITKIVDFDLAPGRYMVQLSEATAPAITAMVVPAR